MELKKSSLYADALANLYRSAFYLARGAGKTGLVFFKKAQREIGLTSIGQIKTRRQQLYWAEKILDEYHRLKLIG